METRMLDFLPPFPPCHNAQNLDVVDEEGNEWRFRLIIRDGKRYPKPVLSAGWREFVRQKGLQKGYKVEFFRVQDQAAGGFRFHIRTRRPVRVFNAVIGYN